MASSALRRDICSEIANHVAAFLDIGSRPAAALAVEEVWAAAFELEQRSVMDRGLIKLAGMLRDQLANHFEMTEFLDRDVLKHVPDAGVLDVKRLHPILKRRGQFACGASKLLEKVGAEAGVWSSDIDGLNQLLAM